MSTHPVVLLSTDNPDMAKAIVAKDHPDLTIHTCDSFADLPAMVEKTEAEAIYSLRFSNEPFPRQAMVEQECVKWVSVAGSGTDHLQPWNPETVTVTNAAGVAADMMAEYCLAGMLHFSLDLAGLAQAQQQHQWPAAKVTPIAGKTVLIIGLGATGKAVARNCKALGMNIIGVRARPQDTDNCDEVHGMDSLPQLWPKADFVVLCVPKLASTHHIVNQHAFDSLPNHAVIMNVARGGVVDEEALLQALNSGAIKGALFDVFASEPLPQDSPLWGAPNLIITPHCSAVYDGWEEKSVQMFSDNLKRYRQGLDLNNIVSPARGY
jgi:phosphoglycerate dehydrogenase-like enzyme